MGRQHRLLLSQHLWYTPMPLILLVFMLRILTFAKAMSVFGVFMKDSVPFALLKLETIFYIALMVVRLRNHASVIINTYLTR